MNTIILMIFLSFTLMSALFQGATALSHHAHFEQLDSGVCPCISFALTSAPLRSRFLSANSPLSNSDTFISLALVTS